LLSSAGRRPKADVLTVFDSNGNEITRQEECGVVTVFTAEHGVCPIIGLEVVPVTAPDGSVEFAVTNLPDDPVGSSRYRLLKGRYVKIDSPEEAPR
jgi:hypothetical protein